MLYAFLGSSLLGSLAVVFLLWRKSVVEGDLSTTREQLKTSQDQVNRAMSEMTAQQVSYTDQLARVNAELLAVKGQRDQALDSLAKAGSSGALGGMLRKDALG